MWPRSLAVCMGLFDSIRRVVGGGDDDADDAATQPDLVDTRDIDVSALRERAESVAGEVGVLDFSLSSLARFDDAIDEGYDEDLATSDRPGAYATDTVRFGCYLGEVLVRVYDGEWTRNPDWGVTIAGPGGTTTVDVFDVAERSITTGAVFAAVADRAATAAGLDTADAAPSAGDDGTDATPAKGDTDGEPAAGEPRVDDRTVDTPGDDTPEVGTPDGDGPTAEASGSDEPISEAFEDNEPPADSPDTGVGPDPAEADPTPSDAADGDDAEPLIEEAEPGDTAADEATDTAAANGETATGDGPSTADGSPFGDDANSGDGTDRDTSPSLFDDAAAGAGPTVDDAPSAEDGPSLSEVDDADRDDGATADADSDEATADSADTGPAAGDDLREPYAEAAEELASFWTEYDLDYTPESLERLDALVSAEWDDDRFDDAEFGSDDSFDDRVFTSVSTELGGYFGEVLVRELDAEWSDGTATDAVVVEGADGPLAIPVFKVAGTSITQQPVFARSYASLLSDLDADG